MIESKVINLSEPTLNFKPNQYPIVSDGLPKPYWVGLWVGSRQSGKTYSCVKLIKSYEDTKVYHPINKQKMDIRTIIISPTFDANPVFNSLNSLDATTDVYATYSDGVLEYIIEDIRQEKEATEKYQRDMVLWNKFMKTQDIEKLSDDEIIQLERMGFNEPHEPKYPNGCFCFLILDDLVGSSAFKVQGRSYLTNVVLKNRHLGINICILTQSMKSVNKPIRVNTSLFTLFKYANQKMILNDIYEEISGKVSENEFLELFDYATEDAHSPLVLDFTNGKSDVFRKGYFEILQLKK